MGVRLFKKGTDVRHAAQVALSRLRGYRAERQCLKQVEMPGDPRSGSRLGPYLKAVLAGAVAHTVGFGTFCYALLALRDLITRDDNPWWGPFAVFLFLLQAVFLIGMGNSILRRGVQYFGGVISSPKDLSPGTYVLYLRSFKDDHRLARPHRIPLVGAWLTSLISIGRGEEERLSAALSWAGPMVGVGQPGERVPLAGARRMYLSREDWKDPVCELMRGAGLVVIALRKGQGTLWEVGAAMRILPPEWLLLLVPMTKKKYEEFRKLAAEELQRQSESESAGSGIHWSPPRLPNYARSGVISSRIHGLIYFKPDWKSEFVPLERPSLLEDQLMGALDRSMWPAMVQLTDYEQQTGRTHG